MGLNSEPEYMGWTQKTKKPPKPTSETKKPNQPKSILLDSKNQKPIIYGLGTVGSKTDPCTTEWFPKMLYIRDYSNISG